MIDWDSIHAALDSHDESELRRVTELLHPADAAAVFESLDADSRVKFGHYLDNESLALAATFLSSQEAVILVSGLSKSDLADVLNRLPDDVLVDLLQEFGEAEREKIFLRLSDEKKRLAIELLQYGEETAGGRMTTAMATVRASMTIRDAIRKLSSMKEKTEVLARIYVVDEKNHLLGKVRLRDLTFNPRGLLIRDVMDTEKIAIRAHDDQEEAVRLMTKYGMVALPVVNEKNQVLGVITFDDALDIQEQESTEDMEKMAGMGGERHDEGYLRSAVFAHFRRRIGWVIGLAMIGIFSGIVFYSFEGVLAQSFLLAIFVPMVVATGGNTGAQAATMVIRAMSLNEFSPAQFGYVVWKELRIGFLIGGSVGLIIAVITFATIQWILVPFGWFHLPDNISLFAFVSTVGIAMLVQVSSSTVAGAALPMAARAVRLDPAVVASPAISTIVDITGLLIYFNIAVRLLNLSD